MFKSYLGVFVWLILLAQTRLCAQDYYNFTQFYVNPSLLNPSLTGADGKSALFLAYKNQWTGLSGAPRIANLNLQTALPSHLNLGVNLNSDRKGLINTSSLLFTGGYTLPVSNVHFVRFGISFGAAWNVVDMDQINFGTVTDPVQGALLDNSFQTLGNVGVSFHSDYFHVGVAVPNIFESVYLSQDAFNVNVSNPFETLIAHASYRMYLANNQHVFEPYVIYRYHQSKPPQLEAAAVLQLQNVIWLGGAYKQDFGISGLGGIKLNKVMSIGYSYTLKNTGANELSFPSHEISVGLLFGEHHKEVPSYSFVNTEKERHQKTYKELLARQKRKEAELKRQYERDKARKEAQAKAAEPKPAETKPATPSPQTQTAQAQPVQQPTQRPVTQPVVVQAPDTTTSRPVQHNAGPRFRHNDDPLANNQQDQQWHDENDRLNRLEAHADDPFAHHEEEGHANAERHEFVKRGNHNAEMNMADYVIAGVFRGEENAKRFSDGLRELGFNDTDYGFLTERNLWYVHISESNDINDARAARDRYRKMKMFKDAWLLTVHE